MTSFSYVMGEFSAHINARMGGALGDGAWEPKTPELFKCSQVLSRALLGAEILGEVVKYPEGPALVFLTLLRSDK